VVRAEVGGATVSAFEVANPTYRARLLKGFYPGTAGWLWTGQEFAVLLDAPAANKKTFVDVNFAIPAELMAQQPAVTLTTKVNGIQVDRTEYQRAGGFTIYREVPPKALETQPAVVEVTLNKAGFRDDRSPMGVIVVSMALKIDEDGVLDRDTATKLARDGYSRLLDERKTKMPVERQRELMKLFHEIPTWQNTWFHNVKIEKNPLDLWTMQQIMYELQPDFIVETGTWRGGSALYWAHTLNGLGLRKSRVLTVDIQDLTGNAQAHPLWKEYVTFFKGSSTDPAIVQKIRELTAGHKTIVCLDSDHTMKHVLNELHAYAPMVGSASYLVVEDTHMDGVPTQPGFGPGPFAAVQAFLAEPEGKAFEQDLSREAFVMTFNPGGWLRRK